MDCKPPFALIKDIQSRSVTRNFIPGNQKETGTSLSLQVLRLIRGTEGTINQKLITGLTEH